MNKKEKYASIILEGVLFTICILLLVVVSNLSYNRDDISTNRLVNDFDMYSPRYVEIVKKMEYKPVDKNNYSVLKTYVGNVSFYGPDCGGCKTGYTASGYKVDKNTTYYTDKEYGNVMIVAGDKSIPFGTILKMNIFGEEKYGIVIDRGDIGFGCKFMFDVLVESEALSYQYGVSYNTKIEVLRYGF